MRYPVALEPGSSDSAFGVIVPDLAGCFSAGDSLDEALSAAEHAASAWVEATLDTGGPIPAPSSLDAIRQMPEYEGWIFAAITLDPAWLDDTTERVNITLPRRILKRLDAIAAQAGDTRSGTIANLTLHAMPSPNIVAQPAGVSRIG